MKNTIMSSRVYQEIKEYIKVFDEFEVLTEERQIELVKMATLGNFEARNELVLHNWRLVIRAAIEVLNYSGEIHAMDIIQEGFKGLIMAVAKFDHTRGTKFSWFAFLYIKGKMYDAIYKFSSSKITKDKSREIKKLLRSEIKLAHELGRIPSDDELARELNTTAEKIRQIKENETIYTLKSLDEYINADEDAATIADFINANDYNYEGSWIGTQSEVENLIDVIRLFATDKKLFANAYKEINEVVCCIPKFEFAGTRQFSVLLSHPIVNRIKLFESSPEDVSFVGLVCEYTDKKVQTRSADMYMGWIIEMYHNYYEKRPKLMHYSGGDVTKQQKEAIFDKYPYSALSSEIENAKTWADISISSIFDCVVKKTKQGKVTPSSFFKAIKDIPESNAFFPWKDSHRQKLQDWIDGKDAKNIIKAEYIANDLISALIYKGYINNEFQTDRQFKGFLNVISQLKQVLLKKSDPTALYMRNIGDICYVYSTKNGYPIIEYLKLFRDLMKLKEEKCDDEYDCEVNIAKDKMELTAWKNLTRDISDKLRRIFSSDQQTQKEQIIKYIESNPQFLYVTRYNSIYRAILEHFSAEGIYNFIHQCADNLSSMFARTLEADGGRADYTSLTNIEIDTWLHDTFFISLKEISDEKERVNFEREQFRNYLGYDSSSMKYVRNIIIATLFETEENINKEKMNQALLTMGFVPLNSFASEFDAIISQAIDLSLEPSIIEEIKTEVLGQKAVIF